LTALPAKRSAQLVNRSVDATTRLGRRTVRIFSTNADRSRQLIDRGPGRCILACETVSPSLVGSAS